MRNATGAISLSFLMAVGGGAALANSNSGDDQKPPSSSSAPSSQTSGSQAAGQQHGQPSEQPQGQANGRGPVGFAEEEVTSAPLTVERIDTKNRNLVVRAPDGTQSTVDIPAGTPGFDSLKKGDKVQIDYFAAEVFGRGQPANGANQTGSTSNHASNQAGGTGSGANNGKVRNIRKVGNSDKTGHSGNTGNSGTQMGNSGNK
jgi:hypothetical protein